MTHRHFEGNPQPVGGVDVWEVEMAGTPYQVMGSPGAQPFSQAASLVLHVADQAELDAFWDGMLEAGGQEFACGWIGDPFGVSWRVTPEVFYRAMQGDDDAAAQRVVEACWRMVRIDVAEMEAAFRG